MELNGGKGQLGESSGRQSKRLSEQLREVRLLTYMLGPSCLYPIQPRSLFFVCLIYVYRYNEVISRCLSDLLLYTHTPRRIADSFYIRTLPLSLTHT